MHVYIYRMEINIIIIIIIIWLTGIMMNNNDSVYSKAKKSILCGHFMPNWDNHRYCFKCEEANKGGELCMLKDCLLCSSFSEEQKHKLTVKHSKGKKSLKDSSVDKSKIGHSILDKDDNSHGLNSQVLEAI